MKFISLIACLVVSTVAVAHADTAKFDAQMAPVAAEYLKIQAALAADKTDGVAAAAKAIVATAAKLDPKTVTGEHAAHYAALPTKISAAATTLGGAKDLADTRKAFKALSQPFAMWATMSKPAGIDVVFCSMAKGSWIQPAGGIKNPYHGASMLTCGEVVGGAGAAKKAAKGHPR